MADAIGRRLLTSRTRRARTFSALGWGVLLAISAAGCPSSMGPTRGSRDVLRPVRTGTHETTAQNGNGRSGGGDLLQEALAGVSEGEETTLDGRMQVRGLRIPHPPAGGNARFNFDGGRRGWVTKTPNSELLTSPAFANGRIFIGGGFASHEFYALDAYSGEMQWAMAAPDGGPSAAIVDEGKVLFNTESCTLFVADAETGELKWKRWLGDPLMSQPVIGGGFVMSAYPSSGHQFGAFRLRDGEPGWTVPIPADVIQAPTVIGNDVYFATMDGTVHKLRVRDGHVHWQAQVGAASALWVEGGKVLLTRRVDTPGPAGTRIEEQALILRASDGRIEHEGERFPAPYLGGDSRDRQMAAGTQGAWGNVPHGQHLNLRNVASGWAFQGSTPAVADGRAYFAVGSEIRARDLRTGEVVWRRSYSQANGAQAISPPAVVGSLLIFGTIDGHLYASDIDTGTTVWAYDVGEPVVFQPIVAQGWVYVGTGRGSVVGLEIGDPMLDGWHMWGGNAQHSGLVANAGRVDPALLASLSRPGQGSMRRVAFEPRLGPDGQPVAEESAAATDANEGEAPRRDASAPIATAVRREEPDLPLTKTRVNARVSGPVARVTVTQEFRNDSDRAIEAVYLFPLPADAAVDDMEMHVGERVIRARIQRRAQARQTYEQARSEGRRAALLEQQRPNLFAQRVANIQPGERIDVQIRYTQLLPFENGAYEMVYPMVAPPRYRPGQQARLSAPPVQRAANEIELAVDVDAGLPIERIASPTHEVEMERHGESHFGVRLATSERIPNRDFVLRYAVGGDVPRATVLAHRAEEGGYFTLLVQPPDQPDDSEVAPRDLVFVVDTSSSMRGRPIEHARAVMGRVLREVRATDTFQVLAFSDRVESLAGTPLSGTPQNVARAISWMEDLRPTGSTELVPAIEAALATPRSGTRLRMVTLVSDGFFGSEREALGAIATNLGDARFYTLGVGASPNRFLLERAAEIGRGRAVVVTLSEAPEAAAARFASYVGRPVFTDVSVDWGGLDVQDVYPRRLPDLFAGKPLVVNGRFDRGGHAVVRVRGTIGGRRYEREIDVTLPTETSADGRHAAQATLWARAAVHERMNRMVLRDDPRLIEEVTQLGLRHRMVTPWTSFVAVDDEPVRPRQQQAASPVATEAQAGQPTISPARSLPGDPEVRIPAPADARAVTLVLPFGETLSAVYEPSLSMWTARFLVPRDAAEGSHPIEVIITFADGRIEHSRLWYTVDSAAPQVRVEIAGEPRPGAEVVIRATQILTRADLEQAGYSRGARLTPERAVLLSDARRVEVRTPDGAILDLVSPTPGTWESRWTIPADASGTLQLRVVSVDLAANVHQQTLEVEVQR